MTSLLPANEQIGELDVELPSRPDEKPWDPEPGRERLRGFLAAGLVLLLAFVVVAAWATLWLHVASQAETKDLLIAMMTPVIALVGPVVGFYFGGKSSSK